MTPNSWPQALSRAGPSASLQYAIEGLIKRMGFQNIGEGSTLHFTLSESEQGDNKVFSAPAEDNLGVILAEVGDRVRFEVMQLDDTRLSVRDFQNLSLSLDDPAMEPLEEH